MCPEPCLGALEAVPPSCSVPIQVAGGEEAAKFLQRAHLVATPPNRGPRARLLFTRAACAHFWATDEEFFLKKPPLSQWLFSEKKPPNTKISYENFDRCGHGKVTLELYLTSEIGKC